MTDFSAQIRVLPREDGRRHFMVGPTWICRLRLGGENHFFASLISGSDYFHPDQTKRLFATLLDTSARSLFKPGVEFAIVDEDWVAATGVVETQNGSLHPSDNTLTVLQTWVRRRPEWFVRARLELTEHSVGWSELIEETFSTIDELVSDRATHLRVPQVKQKLGGLVICVGHQLPDAVRGTIDDKLNEVHARSLKICELCGSAGQRGSQAGFICVRCRACAPEGWSADRP